MRIRARLTPYPIITGHGCSKLKTLPVKDWPTPEEIEHLCEIRTPRSPRSRKMDNVCPFYTMKKHVFANGADKLVDGPGLLKILFTPDCRPTRRWLELQVRRGKIPSAKVGKLRFYNVAQVRRALFGEVS